MVPWVALWPSAAEDEGTKAAALRSALDISIFNLSVISLTKFDWCFSCRPFEAHVKPRVLKAAPL
jgi:hypothetical protein